MPLKVNVQMNESLLKRSIKPTLVKKITEIEKIKIAVNWIIVNLRM